MSAERVRSEDLGRRDEELALGADGVAPEGLHADALARAQEPAPQQDADDASDAPDAPAGAPADSPADAPAEDARGRSRKEKRKDKDKTKEKAKARKERDPAGDEDSKDEDAAGEEAAAEEGAEPGSEPEEEVKRSRLRWKKKEMPAGLFIKCEACSATIFRKELVGKGMVCPTCGFHFTLGGRERIEMVLDEGTWRELFAEIETLDRLDFKDKISYAEKIRLTAERLGQKEALFCGTGEIEGREAVLAVLDFKFMGGSMGEVMGEKIALAVELALASHLPLLVFTSSGGARMHEGMLSLMQMAKTCAALQTLREAGGYSICVMTNPTTGGVTASFASVCDITLAEPGALIGFAGPRVIATTLKQDLPKGFQRAEFLLEKGQLDAIVPRSELRGVLARLIDYGRGAWRREP